MTNIDAAKLPAQIAAILKMRKTTWRKYRQPIWRDSKYAPTIPLASIPVAAPIHDATTAIVRAFTGSAIKTTNAGYCAGRLPAAQPGPIRISMQACDAFASS
ncbi:MULTISPECIES: hypothetical protein [Burkholderia]|uniref:hypothetical protein n=1 Tax=Burkholderia TaxID=32008 RepID=UPI00157AABF1|nr:MULTISPECIES: hypothetical protein [Burkholderia]MCU9953579.1 hypothetical protein [Burkholderia sp. BKH01]NTY35310.1 hypothetical protein [Burkholderia diffusa]